MILGRYGHNGLGLCKYKRAVCKVELPNLCVARIVDTGKGSIRIVQQPVVLELDNRLVRSPSLDRLEQRVLPVKGALWLLPNSNLDGVLGTGRVLEIVELTDLVDRGTLEEAARTVGLHDLAVLVVDDEFLWFSSQVGHVGGELGEAWAKCWAGLG